MEGDVASEKEAPLTDYTREEILKLIEENGGPEGLDLSGKDLSGIDLGREAIKAELGKALKSAPPDETPVWHSKRTEGVNLEGANLQWAMLTPCGPPTIVSEPWPFRERGGGSTDRT